MNPKNCIIHSLTKEEQSLLCFAEPVGYHTRLQQYWAYPQGFAERTTLPKSNISLSTTKTFRCYLRRFIRNFQPEPLSPSSNLWLHLEKNGRFSLRLGNNGEEITDFGEGDFCVFQYLCFLHIRRFWDDVRKCCRVSVVTLPLIVRDFSSALKNEKDYAALLELALECASQVIVL